MTSSFGARVLGIGLAVLSAGPSHAAPVDASTNVSGLWLDANRAAQGLMLEQLDPPSGADDGGLPRVAVSWYTWAPASDAAPGPRWLFGIGRRAGSRIEVELKLARSGNSPVATPGAPAQFDDWGVAEIRFDEWSYEAQNVATVEFTGPVGWGTGARAIKQLTAVNTGIPYDIILDPPYEGLYSPAGTYSDPERVGQGWILNQYGRAAQTEDGEGYWRVESLFIWFTYDAQGRPSWSVGLDSDLHDEEVTIAMLRAASGGTFEGGTPQLEPWGEAYVFGSGGPPFGINCGEVTRIGWRPSVGEGAWNEFDVARLTRPYDPNLIPPTLCFSR
jgi:hypothetical protein